MNSVRITRSRHPLHGKELRILGRMRRHGRVELLLVLPDGSKSLVPAAWTDLDGEGLDAAPGTLGSVADLLALRELVDALAARVATDVDEEQAARQSSCEEDNRAACTAESDTRPGAAATGHTDRRASRRKGHRSSEVASGVDRQNRQPNPDIHRGRTGDRK